MELQQILSNSTAQKIQNRTARILTFSPYDASVENLFHP